MGSGKSTLGRKLARLTGQTFTDLDAYIEQREGRSISAIFRDQGQEVFRELEHRYLQEFLDTRDAFILALGGGTPCFYNNLELAKAKATVVYLRLSPGALYQRLQKGLEERPLLAGKTKEELLAFIDQLLKEREPYYLEAHYVLNGISLSPKELMEAIHSSPS